MPMNRRAVLKTMGAVAIAGAMNRTQAASESSSPKASICLFSKPLHGRPVEKLAEVLGSIGVTALDLTCRPGGHVLPERVADDLPRAKERLGQAGIGIPMLTTDIVSPDAAAHAIVKTAGSLGIRHMRLGPYAYRDVRKIDATLADVKARLRELAALAAEHRVQFVFQNHSGMRVGAPLWDLNQLLEGIPAEAVGSQYDLAHATIEGGDGGWKIATGLMLPRVTMLAVKDFVWRKQGKGWKAEWCPLGEGMVQWVAGLKMLREPAMRTPMTLHVEYREKAAPGSSEEQQTLRDIARDRDTLQRLLREAGIPA